MPLFDEEFFKKLGQLIDDIGLFIKQNWIFAALAAFILLFLIIFQQIILSLLAGKL